MTVCFREVYPVIGARQTELLDLHRQYEKLWSQILKAGVSEGAFRQSLKPEEIDGWRLTLF